MRITMVEIENFRSIKRLSCRFDAVTTFVGPNGAGKSTVLRAIDWFFNGPKGSLGESDIHKNVDGAGHVRVRVDFGDLTPADRELLGERYCRSSDTTWSAWRTWSDEGDKLTGKAFALPEFEKIRQIVGASDKRAAYNQFRTGHTDMSLPACSSGSQVEQAMDAWERDHPEKLVEAEVSDTHLHGFNGQGVLSKLIDFVFVSADLRATAEAEDARGSIFGRILQRAVDRTALDEALVELNAKYQADFAELATHHLGPQLESVSAELSEEISGFVHGRSISLESAAVDAKQPGARIEVAISDGRISTPIGYQGHGFQRTLLLAALRTLARHGRQAEGSSHMVLAIEEPELFQHPTQAKALASVLRSIAQNAKQSVQIAYATHSPHFIEPQAFDQIRRVTSRVQSGASCAASTIETVEFDQVVRDLTGYVDLSSVQRRWEQVCLKYLPEALFAESVILVEGDEDAAILEAMGNGINMLAIGGVCVAPVQGKSNMLIPFAILRRLGVHALMVVDNDSGMAERMKKDGRPHEKIAEAVEAVKQGNRRLCRFVGAPEVDYPVEKVSDHLFFMPDTLEAVLDADVPAWGQKRLELVKEGRGVEGKNAATYALAARECEPALTGSIGRIFELLGRAA